MNQNKKERTHITKTLEKILKSALKMFMELFNLLEKNEILMVKQPKIALHTFDGERCLISIFESVAGKHCIFENASDFSTLQNMLMKNDGATEGFISEKYSEHSKNIFL